MSAEHCSKRASPSAVWSRSRLCRRSDYLCSPASLGGPPRQRSTNEFFDPLPLALRLEAELPAPDLRIGMNPARGMVAVPTWFWVEGYDGGALSQSETVVETHEVCHLVSVRDDRGGAAPGLRRSAQHSPGTAPSNATLSPSTCGCCKPLRVDSAIAPGEYAPARMVCPDALGQPYIDPTAHPSPIQHPYRWSSLGQGGPADAYTVRLGITFGAQFRVTLNGNSQGGWRSSRSHPGVIQAHQVQEAQAVLTRP